MSGGNAMLSCHHCGYLATSPVYLAQHQKRHGLEYEGPWRTCDNCDFATRSAQEFRAHTKQHSRELPQDFKCKDCGKSYQTFKNLEKHCVQVHGKDSLSNMEEAHHSGGSNGNESTVNTFQCSECEFTCRSHGSMWYHQKKMHPTEEDKQKEWHCCQICGLTFVYKQRYYAHMEQYHALSMDEPIESDELPPSDNFHTSEHGSSPPTDKHELRPGQLIIKSEAMSDCEADADLDRDGGSWVDHDDSNENLMLSHDEIRPSSEGDIDIENEGNNENVEDDDETPPSLRQMLERGPSPARSVGSSGQFERRPAGVGFPCDDCDFVAASSSGLWYHRRKVHEPNKMATCPHCDYTAVSSRDVQKHLRKHTNERPFDCKYCERNFTQKNHLFNHIITIHKGEKLPTEIDESSDSRSAVPTVHSPSHESSRPFTCSQCGRAFARKNLLQLHKMTHGMVQDQKDSDGDENEDEQGREEMFDKMDGNPDGAGPSNVQPSKTSITEQCQCTICQKSGPNMVGYNYLKESLAPSGKKRFECSLCRKIFSALCKCLGHIKLLHANASGNPYKCRNCGKCFLAVTSLCGHMRAHRERKKFSFQCGICEKVFQIGEALKRHVVAFHSKAISKEALAAAVKHGSKLKLKIRLPKLADKLLDKVSASENKEQAQDGKKHALPKTMTCSKCGLSFTQGNSYVRHMCKHLNIVPYDCKKCGKLFSSQAVLKAHMQHHNSAQIYQCIRCNFKAKYLTQLYVHMEKHFGKGVHGCVYCTTRFTKKSNIKKHILTKHRGKRLAFEDYSATVQPEEEVMDQEEQTDEMVQNEQIEMTDTQPHPVHVYPAPASISPSRQTPSKQAVVGTPNMRVEISQPDSSQIAEDRPPSTLSSEGSVHTSVSGTPNQAKSISHQQKEVRAATVLSPVAKKDSFADQKCADCLSKTSNNLKCNHCGIVFLDMVMHTIHMGWHGRNDPFECHTCGRNCGDKYGFITHIFREPHN